MPLVLTMVATLSSGNGRNFPRCVRNSRRLTRSGFESCFSKPSGISDRSEALISSISSRRTVCFFASVSISSMEDFVSDASMPVSIFPPLVETTYCRKLPSTSLFGSMMWMSNSFFGCAAIPVMSGPIFTPSP